MADPVTPDLTLPGELPVLPLRRMVVFPMTVQPLGVNRPVSVESVQRALHGDRLLLLTMQEGDEEDPPIDKLRRIATVGILRQMARGPAGLQVIVEGVVRVRVDRTA